MDVSAQLLKEHSRNNGIKVAQYVFEHPNNVPFLIALLTDDQVVFQQRASQSLAYLVEEFRYDFTSAQLENLIDLLQNEKLHQAVHRNILKILELSASIPESREGVLFDYCISQIINPKKPIAVRAFSIPVAFNLSKKYPELKQELSLELEAISDLESPGILHRKKKYLSLLRF